MPPDGAIPRNLSVPYLRIGKDWEIVMQAVSKNMPFPVTQGATAGEQLLQEEAGESFSFASASIFYTFNMSDLQRLMLVSRFPLLYKG
jgi:hypothetical protein